ncbi:hypothetical protein AVEN_221054-1, partial [Araneus ventricosus]
GEERCLICDKNVCSPTTPRTQIDDGRLYPSGSGVPWRREEPCQDSQADHFAAIQQVSVVS